MNNRQQIESLSVNSRFADFVNRQLVPELGLGEGEFWLGLEHIVQCLSARNSQLLQRRDSLQEQIDDWHRSNSTNNSPVAYRRFLEEIGYLVSSGPDFEIDTENVDPEIALQAGPQLVVPLKNARFALNAANARWGSLYDALYGTDVIEVSESAASNPGYDPERGAKVIAFARTFLDQACPLQEGSHHDVTAYCIRAGQMCLESVGGATSLADGAQLQGFTGPIENPSSILLKHNGLHIEILLDPESLIGRTDKAGVKDIILEAAITTIQDCEDSVAAVDAQDKVAVYENWLGLMRGDLSESFVKNGETVVRTLNPDRDFTRLDGSTLTLPGRSLQLIRNVGHLMRNDAVIDGEGNEIYEGILDAVISGAVASIDAYGKGRLRNSRTGSIYIVKPKMHGPDEVQFTCELFAMVEELLGLDESTLKIGIMDEERRTTLNLKECIRAARSRLVFINTGFLDRTGDEIHTSMHAGAVVPKSEMKNSRWISAYENNNVDVGLACGLQGKAQIGKGMWAMPDLMAQMLDEKVAHPLAGASTAWVPSPTAAVLHAMHYHKVDVWQRQEELKTREPANIDDILTIPLLGDPSRLSGEQIQQELDNNAQGILGYVVRWIDQGIGCSKVPDIHNIGLMEDRATLRISSQHIGNWLLHGLCSAQQVRATLERMAGIVDGQNSGEENYTPMSENFEGSVAFKAASDLIFQAAVQPNGYTEPLLHEYRIRKKKEKTREEKKEL